MPAFSRKIEAAQRRLLWLDDTDYSAALLAGGSAPWLDATAFAAWRRKAHGLLKSDVAALPAARVCVAWLDRDPSLRAEMAARSRSNFPLKTLLTHVPLRRHLTDLLSALRSTLPDLTLALVCPSPRAWVTEAYRWAFGPASSPDVGEDEVDAATLHCADFLREFATSGVDAVLLEESADDEPRDAAELSWYRSVLNVGAHYRWDMGLRLSGARFAGELGGTAGGAGGAHGAGGIDFVIAPRPLHAPHQGRVIPVQFWQGAALEPDATIDAGADFRFAQVPLGLAPEAILDRLSALRQP